MISSSLSNRLIFVLSLFGLFVSSFLFYEYNLQGSVICPIGTGCDAVRISSYSGFLGISIPFLGILFYFAMAILSVIHVQKTFSNLLLQLKLVISLCGVGFGVYLTFLEIFVIKAICFWCVLSFILSCIILLLVILDRRNLY
ncbi:vitamin K epoxide reductase family protein [Patescibacteria group bacterium]|nr:vitamin K epoxide reductase family protein [Patescibacteria group bacterium]